MEMSSLTKEVVAIENYRDFVHLELALKADDRLDGHLLQGHVDSIGTIKNIKKLDVGTTFFVSVKSEILPLIVPNGNIAIDGVSLSVGEVLGDGFFLTIIPHTMKNSLLKDYKIGRRVNIETDILNRCVYHNLKNMGFLNEEKSISKWRDFDSVTMRF